MAERDDTSPPRRDEESGTDTEASTDKMAGGWTFEAQANYDPTDARDLTTVVVRAIAEAEDVPITEVRSPPLYEVIDVATVEVALFGRPDPTANGTESAVEFRYNEYRVSVEADGWVTVSRRDGRAAAD